ncbi:MAG: leucine-rich repeat protein, partial [Hominilimicola sp.]
IPDGITSIYGYTFNNCRKLNNIKLPEGLTYIDDRAFYGCSSLTDLTLPSTLKTINELAFSNGPRFKNNELTIPKGVTTITSRSFENIKDLKTINVENGVTKIEYFAFSDNDSLTRINLPSSIKSVGAFACKSYNEEKYATCDIYVDKYKDSIDCSSNWGTDGTIYWKARDFKNTTDNTVVISDVADQTYTGSLIAPNVTVTCNDVELVKDTDYTVSYSNNKNVGTATISITGIGDYTGTITKNFKIVARGISDTTIGSIPNQTYTGNSISALPVITYNGATLTKGTDYTLTYSNNVNVGTATVTIKGQGNFKGTTSKTFSISARAMSDTSVANVSSQTYTGNSISPLPTITYNNKTLKKDTDYTLSYSNNTNAGTATITITGKGNFTGTTSKTFSISARAMSDTSVANISSQTYTGNVISPLPTITYNNKTLKKDTDYTLSYSNNINAGTATITITGKGNFTGTTSKTFSISARAMSDTSVVNVGSQTYTGNSILPLPTITYNNKTLKKDTDYTLSYSDNINAGTATITITGKGNFTGMTSTTFIITQKSAEKLNISEIANQIYTGKEIKPNVVITDTER